MKRPRRATDNYVDDFKNNGLGGRRITTLTTSKPIVRPFRKSTDLAITIFWMASEDVNGLTIFWTALKVDGFGYNGLGKATSLAITIFWMDWWRRRKQRPWKSTDWAIPIFWMARKMKNGGGLVRMKIPATNVEEATNVPRIECLPISMSDALLAENTILETRQKIQTPVTNCKVQMAHYWPKIWSLKNIDFWCTFKVFIWRWSFFGK